jgi:hypothetical protein
MFLSTLWPVFLFTSDLERGWHFCRFYLTVFNAVLTDIATMKKYTNNGQQLTFLTRNKSAEIKYI